jgi:hypothetical protein
MGGGFPGAAAVGVAFGAFLVLVRLADAGCLLGELVGIRLPSHGLGVSLRPLGLAAGRLRKGGAGGAADDASDRSHAHDGAPAAGKPAG